MNIFIAMKTFLVKPRKLFYYSGPGIDDIESTVLYREFCSLFNACCTWLIAEFSFPSIEVMDMEVNIYQVRTFLLHLFRHLSQPDLESTWTSPKDRGWEVVAQDFSDKS